MVAEPKTFAHHWTYDEVNAIKDDVRRELYYGEIFEMPSPLLFHQKIIGRLYLLFQLWVNRGLGESFMSPVDLYLSTNLYFIPDFVFYTTEQMATGEVEKDPRRLTTPPALIVEVLSESTRRNDRLLKSNAYAEFGVANYWIIDPVAKTLEAFELVNGVYRLIAFQESREKFLPQTFEGLEIDLGQLFAA